MRKTSDPDVRGWMALENMTSHFSTMLEPVASASFLSSLSIIRGKAYCYVRDSVCPWGVEWEQKHPLATDSQKVYSTTPINSLFQTCRLYNEKYTNSWLCLLHYTSTTVHSKRVSCDCAANRIIRIIHTMKNKVHLLPFLLFSS